MQFLITLKYFIRYRGAYISLSTISDKADFIVANLQPHPFTIAPLPLSQWERGRGVAERAACLR
jgi:hypothetical protein